MNPKLYGWPFVFVLTMAFSSCQYAELKKEAPAIHTLKTHEKFRITLPEDHSKGENWQVKRDENYQAFEDLGSVWHGPKKGLDINLKPLISGQYTLTVINRSYRDTLAIKQYIVNIED
jgi:hypothetical protein